MPARLSLEQVSKPDECAWITERFARRLSLPPTWLAIRLGCSANTVTLLAGTAWLLSLPTVVTAGWCFAAGANVCGWMLLATAAILWNLGYILDLVDGNLARLYGTASASAFYLDYVFHLLFKPAFPASIGAFLSLALGEPGWLILAVLAIPANWNASESAAEHVIVQSLGKKHAELAQLAPDDRQQLLLGETDIQLPLSRKGATRRQTLRIALQEILSYYGQFSLFSVLAAGDALIAMLGGPAFPLMRLGFLGIGLLMIVRLPARILRDYRRLRPLDAQSRSSHESPD